MLMFEPMVIETAGRGVEKSYPLFSRLLKDRIILISGEIVDDTSTIICSQLLYLEQQDPDKPIYLYINSPGGSVISGLAIYDTMNFITCPVYTIAMGEACSMGSFLLTAGSKRFALKNTTLMYHSVASGFSGTIHDHKIQFDETKRLQELLGDIIVSNTNGRLSKELFELKSARDWYMTAEEALEYNLIDKVLTKREDVKKF